MPVLLVLNNMKKLLLYSSILFLAAALFTGCNDEEGTTTSQVDFDQQTMLKNYGENLIFPAYADLNTKAAALKGALQTFTQNPSEATLATAREALQTARLSWQGVSMFEFGPAEEVQLRKNINTFPAIRSQVESNIQGGSWDFSRLYSEDEKGFPALDYLLWGETGEPADVVANFTSDANATSRSQYAVAVADEIQQLVSKVYQAWTPEGGNYLGTFITKSGNDAGSSLSMLVNNMVKDYEIIKNQKLRNPLGLLSVDGKPAPRSVEAYYSTQSLPLIKANLQAFERVYRGSFASADGPGLEEFLEAHYRAGNTEEDFAEAINQKLTAAYTALEAVPAPLREAVVNARPEAEMAYNQLQAMVPLIKVNLPNTLSVYINYPDTDGD